ncbi:TonB family protein [Arcicella sp. DC2W]|uniref:TonB family protein n=1 Tax=Arcicella gelida TaxID=2984195 RepID=A0ABU5S7Z6_9BACT|nr:TonB family protein [Arcicella sp. DC2W]MEA5404605.1 TonB family protein [Arcicella sp. DC2W]
MKKALNTIVLTFFFFSAFAQNLTEEIDPIQKFIEATVQIPFQAKLANIQGVVAVRITMGYDNLPEKYEITQNLNEECDQEALRVVRLINPKYLNDRLAAKKDVVLEVPFFNPHLLHFNKGYLVEYFDKDKKSYEGQEPTYMRRYLVDTLSGMINSSIEYFTFQNKELKLLETVNLKMDSWKHEPKTEMLENASDSTKIFFRTARSNNDFPFFAQGFYENGRESSRSFNGESCTYYPSGSVATISKKIKEGKENITKSIEWFANGLMASIIFNTRNETGSIDRYFAVWDSQGKQIVKNGGGNFEYCERKNGEVIFYSGLVKEGLKEEEWKGKSASGEVLFEETYQEGKFMKGISFDNGQKFVYDKQEVPAEFIGGMRSLSKHLQKNLTYPIIAQRANAQGRVYVQCNVDTDGTVSDLTVLKGVGFGCDEEAVRVIQLTSGQWKPGQRRGKIVKTRFTLPISFTMN